MNAWDCMVLWNSWMNFTVVLLKIHRFGRMSFASLEFYISSYNGWNLVIFFLNDRPLHALWFGILCEFSRSLCWDRLRFPFWAIFDRLVLRFYEYVWFGMPNIFDMLFFPRFRHAGLFQRAGRAFGYDFGILNSVDRDCSVCKNSLIRSIGNGSECRNLLIRSTELFRCAESDPWAKCWFVFSQMVLVLEYCQVRYWFYKDFGKVNMISKWFLGKWEMLWKMVFRGFWAVCWNRLGVKESPGWPVVGNEILRLFQLDTGRVRGERVPRVACGPGDPSS